MRIVYIVLGVIMLFLTGCSIIAVVDEDGERHSLSEYFFEEGDIITEMLKAKLTGSIYEEGDQITVFGTCLDVSDTPVNASVFITIYYPNGTMYINTTNVTEITTGYWYYSDVMSSVGGTYLTVWTCQKWGEQALAHGEWQNPAWVNRISTIEGLVENLTFSNITVLTNFSLNCDDNLSLCSFIQNLNDTVINMITDVNMTVEQIYTLVQANNVSLAEVLTLLYNMNSTIIFGFDQINQSFEVVFDKIESINATIVIQSNATNVLVEYGTCVANHSVDRTDSYLAQILNNIAVAVDAPLNGDLSYINYTLPAFIREKWKIRVEVNNEFNEPAIYENGVRCNITIFDETMYTDYQMDWISGRGDPLDDQNCQGRPSCTDNMREFGYFEYEYIWEDDTDGNWSLSCFYDPEVLDVTNFTASVC